MAQQGEVNQNESVKGLFTEGSPLNFPAGATVRDENFILNTDGSRERRLGLGNEINAVASGAQASGGIAYVYYWNSVNNEGDKNYVVINVPPYMHFFDRAVEPLSNGLVYTYTDTGLITATFTQACNINGYLVVVGEGNSVNVFYEEEGTIKRANYSILVRDIWGIDDPLGISERPATLSTEHAYNLANQGWNKVFAQALKDNLDIGNWPSNADVVSYGILDTGGFQSDHYGAVPFGNTPAPKGSAIVPLLSMEGGREDHATVKGYSGTDIDTGQLADNATGGARTVASYAGRVFYAGFESNSATNNDTYPNLESMLVFSRSVQARDDIVKAYQQTDPTSDQGEVLDSDGGTLTLSGTGTIYKLMSTGKSLLVFASEGVWEVYSTDQVFSATNYQVRKLTDIGCTNRRSVITVENVPMYWTNYGIYALQPNEVSESYVATNITATTIQSFYDNIGPESINTAFGMYDKLSKKARWLYSSVAGGEYDRELIFDSRLQSWYTNVYPLSANDVIGFASLDSFRSPNTSADVPDKGKTSYKYVVRNNTSNELEFYEFNRGDFKDFGTTDAEAVMVTGPYSGGDSVRRKSSTYLTMQLRKTETGFEEVGGEIQPVNAGSCVVETRWDWTNLAKAGKFNDPIEMYRHRRHYMPVDVNDGFDDGNTVITTKSRLRGSGRAIAIKISSSPEKDLNLLGWNFQITQNDKV